MLCQDNIMNKVKLSEIMIEMAKLLLKEPEETPNSEACHAALLLASIAWNREIVGDDFQSNNQYDIFIKEIEKYNPLLWDEFISLDYEDMILKLRKYKRNKYLFDTREIISCGTNKRENIEVKWSPQKKRHNNRYMEE